MKKNTILVGLLVTGTMLYGGILGYISGKQKGREEGIMSGFGEGRMFGISEGMNLLTETLTKNNEN